MHNAAKDSTTKIDQSTITKDSIWVKNGSGYSPVDLACKYHNVSFLSIVKDVLGDDIVKKPFEGEIVSILDVDPDASSIMAIVEDFYNVN